MGVVLMKKTQLNFVLMFKVIYFFLVDIHIDIVVKVISDLCKRYKECGPKKCIKDLEYKYCRT